MSDPQTKLQSDLQVLRGGTPIPAGQSPQETTLDGWHGTVVQPNIPGKPEFPPSTEVFFVNGIATPMAAETRYAQSFADAIHGPVREIHAATSMTPAGGPKSVAGDILTTTLEKFGRSNNPPENAVEAEVLKHIRGREFEGDVHLLAHSRGALVTQRGLERVEAQLKHDGWSQREIQNNVFAHVSVETVGGASTGMPAGVRCVNYVNQHDSVANVLGFGKPTASDERILGAAGAGTSFLGGTLGAGGFAAADAKITYDRDHARPQGPVVSVPPVPHSGPPESPYADMMENHHFPQYLQQRRPFEATYRQWETHGRPATQESTVPRPDIQAHVDRANGAGGRFPAVRSTADWNGKPTYGSFVHLGDGLVAQHLGRGAYAVFDVARDLHGVQPPEAVPMSIDRHGSVQHNLESPSHSRR